MDNEKIIAWDNVTLIPLTDQLRCKTCGKKARFGNAYCKRHVIKPIFCEKKIPSIKTLKKLFPNQTFQKKNDWLAFLNDNFSLPIPKEKKYKLTFEELFRKVKFFVKQNKELFKQAECVLIENQPTLKNPRMKTIQVLLYTLLQVYTKNKEISLYNPKRVTGSSYNERKNMSIEKAKSFLQISNQR